MKKPFILLVAILLGSVTISDARAKARERDQIIPGTNPIGCNTVVHIVERFDSGFWVTESVTVTYSSCNGGGGWLQ